MDRAAHENQVRDASRLELAVVTLAWNGRLNIEALLPQLRKAPTKTGVPWEIILADANSTRSGGSAGSALSFEA